MLITGRSKSGKTTYLNIMKEIKPSSSPILFTIECKECSPDEAIEIYKENQLIILVDTPAILCIKRSDSKLQLKEIIEQDILIEYIKELPNCVIIKNNLTIDDFKVKIKRLSKNI